MLEAADSLIRDKVPYRELGEQYLDAHHREHGLDHGVGHSLLLLYDAKTSYGQKIKEFKGLDHNSSNASISLF